MDHDPLKSAYKAIEPDDDDGFSDRVMARIRAERRRRSLILGCAAASGMLMALPSVTVLAKWLGMVLTHAAALYTAGPPVAALTASMAIAAILLLWALLATE